MSALDTLISGGDVLLPDGLHRLDLGLKDGVVAGVYLPRTAPEATKTIDAYG